MPADEVDEVAIQEAFEKAYGRFERDVLKAALRREKAAAERWAGGTRAEDEPSWYFSNGLRE
ncbi:hypothetical protein [Alienimonas sp. DA493]|uniref:hypothetical protein n=1 Tax=Alienimonas sp. DA493 TaxID=3373605 RepID=UPI0037540D70